MKKDFTINNIGTKAYSLLKLKEAGLFEKKLYISQELPQREDFYVGLIKAGFIDNAKNDNDRMYVRFSHPTVSIKLPKMLVSSFSEAYDFIKVNYRAELTIIVHGFIRGRFGGTIFKRKEQLIMEFIESEYSADYASYTDSAVINSDSSARFHVYTKKRQTPVHTKKGLEMKSINQLSDDEITNIYKGILPLLDNIKNYLSSEFNALEFLITKDFIFHAIELQKLNVDFNGSYKDRIKNVLEVKSLLDLDKWDKKQDLLLSVPSDVDRADELLMIIEKIQPYLSKVYISYGLLSHPAILLREAGITPIRKTSNYRVYEISNKIR